MWRRRPRCWSACRAVCCSLGLPCFLGPGEFIAQFIGHAHEIELHREALLEAVALVDVDRVDPVEGLLGRANAARVLGGALTGDGSLGLVAAVTRAHHAADTAGGRVEEG